MDINTVARLAAQSDKNCVESQSNGKMLLIDGDRQAVIMPLKI